MDATPPPAPPPPPVPVPAASPAGSEADGKTIAIISYITIFGFIIALVMHNGKKTQIGAYHLRQMLGLILTWLVCWPLVIIPILGWIALPFIWLGMIVLWIMGLVSALNGQMKPVPVLGPLYQQWFGKAFD